MATDPVLGYAGPESRSLDVTVIQYGGAAVVARAVIGNFETSVGEASAAFALAGPVAWIAYDGDPSQIEFVQYTEAGTGDLMHRRVTKRERTSSNYNTVKMNLSTEAAVIGQRADFGADFSSKDFST